MGYIKTVTKVIYSESSDYSQNLLLSIDNDDVASTAATKRINQVLTLSTSPRTIDLADFTTIVALRIKNLSTTIAITASCTTTAGAAALYIPAGQSAYLSQVTPSGDLILTAASSTPQVEIVGGGT